MWSNLEEFIATIRKVYLLVHTPDEWSYTFKRIIFLKYHYSKICNLNVSDEWEMNFYMTIHWNVNKNKFTRGQSNIVQQVLFCILLTWVWSLVPHKSPQPILSDSWVQSPEKVINTTRGGTKANKQKIILKLKFNFNI